MSLGEAWLLFDECIPRPILTRVSEFLGPEGLEDVVLRHLFEIAPPGTPDQEWIPRIRDEGWTIVTADGGRKPNKRRGRKLPDLCGEYGITLVVLSPTVHQRKALDKRGPSFRSGINSRRSRPTLGSRASVMQSSL